MTSPLPPINLPEVTLLIYNPDKPSDLSARALLHTLSIVRPARAVHLCNLTDFGPPLVNGPWELVDVPMSPWDVGQHYQAIHLIDFLETPMMLHIETDGFPVHPENWDPEFLEYDYIGAPWGTVRDGATHSRSDKYRVGNAGCSLQSRTFREACWRGRRFYRTGTPSDQWFCQMDHFRKINKHLRFAPIPTAIRFSYEGWIPEFPHWDPEDSFAVHGAGFHRRILNRALANASRSYGPL